MTQPKIQFAQVNEAQFASTDFEITGFAGTLTIPLPSLSPSEEIFRRVTSRPFTILSGYPNSVAIGQVAPAGDIDYDIKRNGSLIGKLTFSASGIAESAFITFPSAPFVGAFPPPFAVGGGAPGSYFVLPVPSGHPSFPGFYAWYDVTDAGGNVDPGAFGPDGAFLAGYTGISITVFVADPGPPSFAPGSFLFKTLTAITGVPEFAGSAPGPGPADITITHSTGGTVAPIVDGTVFGSGTIGVGISAQTVLTPGVDPGSSAFADNTEIGDHAFVGGDILTISIDAGGPDVSHDEIAWNIFATLTA